MGTNENRIDLLIKLNRAHRDLINMQFKSLISHINKNVEYNAKRLDDIDKRLCVLELKMDQSSRSTDEHFKAMKKETGSLPDMFTMLEQDGIDIAGLQDRIIKLES